MLDRLVAQMILLRLPTVQCLRTEGHILSGNHATYTCLLDGFLSVPSSDTALRVPVRALRSSTYPPWRSCGLTSVRRYEYLLPCCHPSIIHNCRSRESDNRRSVCHHGVGQDQSHLRQTAQTSQCREASSCKSRCSSMNLFVSAQDIANVLTHVIYLTVNTIAELVLDCCSRTFDGTTE